MEDFDRDNMLGTFIYEMNQMLELLENNIVAAEGELTSQSINEIFRIMHTIKGSAAMMLYNNISTTAHAIEDLFFYLREKKPDNVDIDIVTDLTLEVGDFVKEELEKIETGSEADGDSQELINRIKEYVEQLKNEGSDQEKNQAHILQTNTRNSQSTQQPAGLKMYKYSVRVYFQQNCEMENVRAYTIVHNLREAAADITYEPSKLMDEGSVAEIRAHGFSINFISYKDSDEIRQELMKSLFIKEIELNSEEISESEIQNRPPKEYFRYEAVITFEEGCEMENVRAYGVVYNLTHEALAIETVPEDLVNEASIDEIRTNGFLMKIVTDKSYEELFAILNATVYLNTLELKKTDAIIEQSELEIKSKNTKAVKEKLEKNDNEDKIKPSMDTASPNTSAAQNQQQVKKSNQHHAISVNVNKLDLLLNLVGELVTSEAMVTQNPDLEGLSLDSFTKEASHLRKIIKDVQDTVMSMRMVPLSPTFFKMHRIVRDMCKQLGKEVVLEIVGENTEVDKNIIEHIGDPLMHIIRNCIDHGIEMPDERSKLGKNPKGTVLLEAKNAGGDVLINIKDDGAGLNRQKILAKAKSQGMLTRPEDDYSDKEVYNFIFLPGFSTNEAVTSYSGRGVGMDVVTTNIEMVGGTVIADSAPSKGSLFTLKIPLTLAIIEGMTIKLGGAKYTIPIVSIIRSFKAKNEDLLTDPNGNEMIMVRGECYNLVRLKEEFRLDHGHDNIEDGIVMMLENGSEIVCILVDELIGEQQVVVKNIPKYIKKTRGISGCAILGNGDISLIIDVAGFFDH